MKISPRLMAVAFVCVPMLVLAQAAPGTAALKGIITDAATGAPLADVVLTVSSPAQQGEQTVVTDAEGVYQLAQLAPGAYELRFEREGYKPLVRADLALHIDRTYRVNVSLVPEAVQGDVVVLTAVAPSVDVGSSSTGFEIGPDHLQNLPLLAPGGRAGATRSFEGLAEMVPQATGDRFGFGLNGGQGPENQFFVDGMSINEVGFGVLSTPLSTEFVRAANVITGGYMPEYGRSIGGIFNVVTKSGSNAFHGSVFGRWAPGALGAGSSFIVGQGSSIASRTNPANFGDFGFEVGGPIIKDRLWFFAGFNASLSRLRTTTKFVRFTETTDDAQMFAGYETDASGLKSTQDLPGTEKDTFASSQTYNYIGKLTFSPVANHKISLSVYGAPTTSGGPNERGLSPLDGAYDRFRSTADPYDAARTGPLSANGFAFTNQTTNVALSYAGSFLDRKLLLDLTGGFHAQRFAQLPVDGSTLGATSGLAAIPQVQLYNVPGGLGAVLGPDALSAENRTACTSSVAGAERCPLDRYFVGGTGFISDSTTNRIQAKAVATIFARVLGHHIIKVGLDSEFAKYNSNKAYSGGTILREPTPYDATLVDDLRRFGYFTAPGQFQELAVRSNTVNSDVYGGFVQDSWSILDAVTLNAGLRLDQQAISGGQKLGIVLPSQLSPRVGLIYDFTQKGRSKVFVNYGRFFELMPLNMADRNFPPEAGYYGARNNTAHQCDFVRPDISPDQVKAIAAGSCNIPPEFSVGFNTLRTPVDPNLQAQSSDEIVGGFEYQVFADVKVGLTGTYRWLNAAIEDMSRDEGHTYFIGNPGFGIAKDFQKAERVYQAGTVSISKANFDSWFAQASYTLSHAYGNYPGFYQAETGQLDPNMNSNFDLLSLLPNRTGDLPSDHRHSIKVYGAKSFDIGSALHVVVSGSYRGLSGAPFTALAGHPAYGDNEVFVVPRGSAGRLPWLHTVDARLAVTVKLPANTAVTLGLDVFNLFNFQSATEYDQKLTGAAAAPIEGAKSSTICQVKNVDGCVTALDPTGTAIPAASINPNFSRPTTFQAPRIFRFEARFSF